MASIFSNHAITVFKETRALVDELQGTEFAFIKREHNRVDGLLAKYAYKVLSSQHCCCDSRHVPNFAIRLVANDTFRD